jgi:prolyl oligopeptidase
MNTMPSVISNLVAGGLAFLLCGVFGTAAAVAAPPLAPVRPYSETLFGKTLDDPYRYMESLDSETLTWIKAQGTYTRALFDSIEPRADLERRIAEFGAGFGVVAAAKREAEAYQVFAGRVYYTEREPGSDNLDLFVRDMNGSQPRKLVDIAAIRALHGGKPMSISYFDAAPDGSKVAVGIAEAGSENASVHVYDVATGRQIAGPVARIQFARLAWSSDGRTLFMNRLAELKSGDPPSARYQNSTVVAWDLKAPPKDIIGTNVGSAARWGLKATDVPFIKTFPGSPIVVFDKHNGVQNETEYWISNDQRAIGPNAGWQLLVEQRNNITRIAVRGEEVFLLSHQDAPTFKILSLHAGQPLTAARTLVGSRSDRVIEDLHAAADGLYVLARQGVYSRLLFVATGTDRVSSIELPFEGYISEAFSDPRVPGITLTLESWVVPPTLFAYDPEHRSFVDLRLGSRPAHDPGQFRVRDLQARGHDGVLIPLTLLEPVTARGPQIVLLEAYGSYGISILPEFSARVVAFMREGADYAVCHVRGGGELGEPWRLAGKDANKPNTWRDVIACSEDLIARGITTGDKLFIMGRSAGGIAVGRALTERPDLFAGVIDGVPAANTVRMEFSVSGPPNIPEFGTIRNEQGFSNLLAMDSYQAVKPGTRYPAVLITTGLNDPRVSPWEPAKFAARLQASATTNPVLLRVDEQAGHGMGSTKTQRDAEFADMVAFIFWRAGRAHWEPKLAKLHDR